jgi:HTH-type transcriptional regulator, competence development regulator
MAAGLTSTKTSTLGARLRHLRETRHLPLWKVAHAAEMDSTLLSKIELGQRFPTREQTAALAKFFSANTTELESMRMAERFLSENTHDPKAAALALIRIRESAPEYFAKKRKAVSR